MSEYSSHFNNCLKKMYIYLYCINYFVIDEHPNRSYGYNTVKYFHLSSSSYSFTFSLVCLLKHNCTIYNCMLDHRSSELFWIYILNFKLPIEINKSPKLVRHGLNLHSFNWRLTIHRLATHFSEYFKRAKCKYKSLIYLPLIRIYKINVLY